MVGEDDCLHRFPMNHGGVFFATETHGKHGKRKREMIGRLDKRSAIRRDHVRSHRNVG